MKNLGFTIGLLLFAANLAVLLLLTSCPTVCVVATSLVIAIGTLLITVSSHLSIKDAFKISLPFLYSFCALVEYILCFYIPEDFKNDGHLLTIIILIVFQIASLIIVNAFSKFDN